MSLKVLNNFYVSVRKVDKIEDYNVMVDKILEISPLYDKSGRKEHGKVSLESRMKEEGSREVESSGGKG